MALKSSFLARHFGPGFLGTRNWLLISALFLIGIALLSGFALFPFSGLVFAAIIGLKIGAFIGFLAGMGMGVKALIDDYVQKSTKNKNKTKVTDHSLRDPLIMKSEATEQSRKMTELLPVANNARHCDCRALLAMTGSAATATTPKMVGGEQLQTQYYWFPYLRDMLFDDFLPWLKSPANAVKFVFGFLLLAGVVSVLLCVCCPAIALAIPGVTVVVSFVGAAFEACSLFAGSWFFTAAFLGVVAMLAYDVLLRVGDVFCECCAEEDVDKVTQKSATGTQENTNIKFSSKNQYDLDSEVSLEIKEDDVDSSAPIDEEPVTDTEIGNLIL